MRRAHLRRGYREIKSPHRLDRGRERLHRRAAGIARGCADNGCALAFLFEHMIH